MYQFFSLLLFILLHLIFVFGALESADLPSYQVLPLIFIKHKGTLLFPNKIKTYSFETTNLRHGIRAMAKFATNKHEKQVFFCPADTDEEKAQIGNANSTIYSSSLVKAHFSEYIISENCLLQKHYETDDILTCSKEATPTIFKILIGKAGKQRQELCGPDNKGKLYMFGYPVCPVASLIRETPWYAVLMLIPSMRKFLRKMPFIETKREIYKICYDHEAHETIYTQHNLRAIALLFDNYLNNERKQKYSMETNNFDFFDKDIDKMASFFNEKQDSSSSSSSSTIPFLAKQLVPSADMPFALWRKPTFHFINVKRMNEELIPLWEEIEDKIRKQLNLVESRTREDAYDVYTGAFTISHEYETVEGNNENIIQMPTVWIKIIHLSRSSKAHKSPGVAILLRNDFDYEIKKFRGLCQQDYCSSYKKQKNVKDKFSGLLINLRCCEINYEITSFFGLILWDNVLLEISELVENK